MENATKATWVTNSKRFALEADGMERKNAMFLRLSPEHAELLKESSDLAQERFEAKRSLAKRMGHFKSLLGEVQSRLQNNNWLSPHHDLQRQLEKFEEKITAFKLIMRSDFDSMEASCKSIEVDIIQLAKNIGNWSKETSQLQTSLAEDTGRTIDASEEDSKRNADRSKQDLERRARVGAIDRKLAGLRKSGGWDARDHDAFIRIWNQVIDMNELLNRREESIRCRMEEHADPSEIEFDAQSVAAEEVIVLPQQRRRLLQKKLSIAVPIKNAEECEEHIKWYMQFLHLSELKKKVVADWKREQDVARRKSKQEALISEVLETEESVADINGILSRHQSESALIQQQIAESERLAAKERIAKWKADCATKKREEEIEKQQKQQQDKTRGEEERKKRQQRIRLQLEVWKKTEALSRNAVQDSKMASVDPKGGDAALLRKMQNRDLEAAKMRQQRVDEANQKKTIRETRIRDASASLAEPPKVYRDRNRLTAPTKAFEGSMLQAEDLDIAERRRSSSGAHNARIPLQGRDLHNVGRATPTWCKAMK